MKKIRLFIAVCGLSALFLVLLSPILSARTSSELIEDDLQAGEISTEEAVIYRAMAAIKPDLLPREYRSDETEFSKCATDLLQEALLVMIKEPAFCPSSSKDMMARPIVDAVYESPQGLFRLHYDTTGDHSVPLADTNSNGVPDYVERAGIIADSCWEYEVNILGYLPPPSDGTQGGGVDQYDIYFQTMPTYGYTEPELPGPEPWDDYTSHFVVNSTFSMVPPNDDPEGDQIGALKVTIAHEFFHAVQFAYDVFEESYFMEMCAVWMEEMAYPEVNDNYNYLPDYFFAVPHYGLQHDGMHRYGSFVWIKYLEENFSIDIIKDMWVDCRYGSAIGAFSYVLDTLDTNLETEFLWFLNWNFMTAARADIKHYRDAADYPEVHIMRAHTVLPDSDYYSVETPEPLASNYIEISNTNGYIGILTFDFSGMVTANWGISYAVDYGSNVYSDSINNTVSDGSGKIYIPYFQDVLRVIVAPGVVSTYGSEFNYTYDIYIRPQGDADGNHIVEIGDVVFIVAYIFAGGHASHPVGAMDADCNKIVEVSDAVFLINYIFNSGPAPCE